MKNVSRNLSIPLHYGVIFFLLFISKSLCSQQVVQIGAGEYFTSYRTDDGKLYATKWGHGNVAAVYNVGLTKVVDVDGAQYTNVALRADGSVYVVGIPNSSGLNVSLVATDNLGNAFKGNSKVYGFYQCYLSLRKGNVWYWGTGDVLNMNNGANIAAPMQLRQPPGKAMVKLIPVSATTFGSLTYLWGLASDGTVWQWDRTHATPFQVNFPGGNIAEDITMVGPMAFVIKTSNDLLTWGYDPSYAGGVPTWQQSGIQSVKAAWQNAGCVFPIKEMVGNYNTLHIIDANNNMFASGSNPQGEIGNGIEYPTWSSLSPNKWQWDWGNGQMMTKPMQIPGKFKNLSTGNTITFYLYVQDMGNNWYSWGRNKALSLGNGLTLSINDYGIYPEGLNVPAPTLVKPLTQSWHIVSFNPNGVQPVLANAGVNQYISSSSTTLYGSGSSQQNGKITSYSWRKISGTGGVISSPSSMNTAVTGLVNGTYIFQLMVKSNLGRKATSKVTIVVGRSNRSPIANAGKDTVLLLPVNSIVLNGKGSDPDGSIASYQWTKVGGPVRGVLSNATSARATYSNMVKGVYVFELKVADNTGNISKDTIQVTVNESINKPPLANAGTNKTTTLPVNSVTLTGSGTDTDGTVSSYRWVKVSGPAFGTISTASAPATVVNNLVEGIYQYELTVTDNKGSTAKDRVQVTVKAAANKAPVANAGRDQTFMLPTNGATFITIRLAGSGKDTDGTISSYAWVKLSGPSSAKIATPNTATTTVRNLSKGTYQFQLTVTDSRGAKAKDTVQVKLYSSADVKLLPAVNPLSTIRGLEYKYYEGSWTVLPAFSSIYPIKTGTTANFNITLANRPSQYGFSFTGFVVVPYDGQYTFYTSSDDGSKLFIDNVLAVANDGVHGKVEKSGTIGLKAGKHAITVHYFQKGGPDLLVVSYEGMGITKQPVPSAALYRTTIANRPTVSAKGNIDSLRGSSISDSQFDLEQNMYSLYPNPFTNSFKVKINNKAPGKYTLVLTDMSGKKIYQKDVIKNGNPVIETIQVNYLLQKGTYLLQIIGPDRSETTEKIIKE